MKLLPSKKAMSTMVTVVLIAVVVVAAFGVAWYIFAPKPVRAITGTVTVWHGLTGSEEVAARTRITAFNKEYPNITVRFVWKPNLKETLKVAIPAGQGPDLFTWAHDWTGEFAAANLTLPIDNYVDQATKDLYFPAALSAGMYKGKLYALPIAAEAISLIYNKAFVQTPPENTDQLIQLLNNPPTGAQYALAHVAQNDPYHMYPWVTGFGGFYYNDTSGLVGLNTSGTIAAAQWFKDNVLPKLNPDLGYGSQTALFYEKKAAMMIGGPWTIGDVKKANISYGLALIPKLVPKNSIRPAPYLGVKVMWWTKNVKTENVEAVTVFMKWWCGVDNQIALAKVLGWVPVAEAAYEDPEIRDDPTIAGFGRQIEFATPIPASPQMGEVWGPGGDAWGAVLSGAKSPQVAFQEAQDTAITNIKTKYGKYP
ncbi:MAG TPA: extracellular solute-binding protein [Candidatus Bathyarchaeia archaeon]|nr:extracellular solute-binding protein [Candidatus Bathyarchaeia archaeon]